MQIPLPLHLSFVQDHKDGSRAVHQLCFRHSRRRNMIRYLVLIISFLLIHIARTQQPSTSQQWKTLSGKRPVVIARGGMSGLFPDSSDFAYSMATSISLKDAVMFCDLQLTKDSTGFCLSEIRLDNATNIAQLYPQGQKTYKINGKDVTGWFAVGFTADELFPNTTLTQSKLTRTDLFDNLSPIVLIDDLISFKPAGIWLNVQYDKFYNQHQISPATFVETYPGMMEVQYISSPEIGFLKSINPKINKKTTKIILRFLQSDVVEPTTKETYSAILKKLATVKEFASGILVPKDYIYPIGKDMYLQSPTNLVTDAHNLGLEVYASGFANDFQISYNYSYDPTLEYLQFVDNSQFAVDGVLTDFAVTASGAIACIAHNKNATRSQHAGVLIISHNGASGVYAACTDLAYEKAVNDGADIIDCSVQMSKDGVAFCSTSADLTQSTDAITSFMSQSTTVPEVQKSPGIFSFDLAWSDVQKLKPQLTGILESMPRNPAAKNQGKFMTLAGFLDFAKKKAVSGILINIENAVYLASKKSLDITNAVTTALKNATLDKTSTQKVFIQSDDSSVLNAFKGFPAYRKVYAIPNEVTAIDAPAVKEIKKFADIVNLSKNSLITLNGFFTANDTHLVKQMHDANISVLVSVLYNEFTAIPFDMFADPIVNLATFIVGLHVDGVVTDYPATARNYLWNPCHDQKAEYKIEPTQIGSLLSLAGTSSLPPQAAPTKLEVTNIVEPPLPEVSKRSAPRPSPDHKSSASIQTSVASLTKYIMSILVFSLLYAH